MIPALITACFVRICISLCGVGLPDSRPQYSEMQDPGVRVGARYPAIHSENHGEKPVDWRVGITPTGAALLECRSDWVALNGIQRWVGGVQLDSRHQSVWRYDPGLGLSRERV